MISSSVLALQKQAETRVELSTQDIDILNEIVNYASVIPETTPWNALFKAYDAILKARRIDPRQDDRCFRFLMRMGDVQGPDWNEKFHNLLGRWGYPLPLPFSTSAESTGVLWRAPSRTSSAQGMMQSSSSERRASLSERPASIDGQPNQMVLHSRGLSPERHRVVPNMLRNRKVGSQEERQRMDEERRKLERAEAKREFAFPLSLITEATKETAFEDVRSSESASYGSISQNDGQSFHSEQQDENDPYFTETIPPIRSQDDYLRAAANAAELYNLRIQHALFKTFTQWRELTGRVYRYHEMQRQLAIAHDRRILASQTLEVWREKTYWKTTEQQVEQDRTALVAVQLIRRWKGRTIEIVQRRKRVNDGLLLRRYFVAWREQTTDTERIIQRFKQRHAVRLFRDTLQKVYDRRAEAEVLYERNLAYRAYWTWYYAYCGSRASLWYQGKRKLTALAQIRQSLQDRRTQNFTAIQFSNEGALRSSLRAWAQSLKQKRENDRAAILHRERTIMTTYFRFWRKAAQLTPAADAIQDVVNDRILYEALSLWRTRLRQTKAARQVYKVHALRSTVHAWRLELRAQAWRENDRLVKMSYGLNTLAYRWRTNILQDLCRKHLLEAGLRKLREAYTARAAVMDVADRAAQMVLSQRLQTSALLLWKSKMSHVLENRVKAEAYDKYTTIARFTSRLVKEHVRIQDMNQWATSAHYFLETKKFLGVWRNSLERIRRSNRRTAYNHIVQKHRQALKEEAMGFLLEKLRQRQDTQRLAEDFVAARNKDTLLAVVAGWYRKKDIIDKSTALAIDFRALHLLKNSFDALKSKQARVNDLYTLAQIHIDVVGRDRTTNVLRKWNMSLFSRKTDDVKAELFYSRVSASHKKAVFRQWRRYARGKIEERHVADQLRREQDDAVADEYDDRETLLDEGFSMLNIGEWMGSPLLSSSLTPAPPPKNVGRDYPKTPSGRAARARDMMHTAAHLPHVDLHKSVYPPADFRKSVSVSTSTTTPKGSPFLPRHTNNAGLNISLGTSRFGRSENSSWTSLKTGGGVLGKSARYARSVGVGASSTFDGGRSMETEDDYVGGSTTAVTTSDGLS